MRIAIGIAIDYIVQIVSGLLCDFTTYKNTETMVNTNIPFVGEPPEPLTGYIPEGSGESDANGYRGDEGFVGIRKAVYSDGVTEFEEEFTGDPVAPIVGPVVHSSGVFLDTGNVTSVSYAKEFQEDFYLTFDGNPSSNKLLWQGLGASARFFITLKTDGAINFSALGDTGAAIPTFSGTINITDNLLHKVSIKCIDTVLGTPGNFDLQILIDGVLDNESTDIDLTTNGWSLSRWLSGNGTAEGYALYEIRSTVNGYWILNGRLKLNGDATQGKFENMVNEKVFTITNLVGISPYQGNTYYLDREGFNV